MQEFFNAELLAATLAEDRFGVNFPLHDVKLAIYRGKPAFGLNQNEPIHTIGDVVGNHRCGAVINKEPGYQCLELDDLLVTGISLCCRRATTRTGRGMKIDGMNHAAISGILEVHFKSVADPHAEKWTGYFAVERPVAECSPFSQSAFQFHRQQIDANRLRFASADRR